MSAATDYLADLTDDHLKPSAAAFHSNCDLLVTDADGVGQRFHTVEDPSSEITTSTLT
ncbi:MAG TPA: hypothetical protein VJX67_02210 [Blastocatellia bacterium]|nr:hypothetical protein [Blastocatellia bacterium]